MSSTLPYLPNMASQFPMQNSFWTLPTHGTQNLLQRDNMYILPIQSTKLIRTRNQIVPLQI